MFVFFIKFICYFMDFTSIKIPRIHEKELPMIFHRHKVDVKVQLVGVDFKIPVVPFGKFIIGWRIANLWRKVRREARIAEKNYRSMDF